MKKYSDYFSGLKGLLKKAGNRTATTALFMVAAITMGFAQDLIIVEGSIYSFNVVNNPENTFEWKLMDESFTPMDPSAFTFIEGQFDTDVTMRFNDLNRSTSEIVYMAVTETRPVGCSTTRALKILVEPNNMYLEFADNESQDCFNMTDYEALLKVGLNFKDKLGGVPIPENRFPLQVEYTVRNITAGTTAEPGNGGNPLTLVFNSENEYFLLVKIPEAVGLPDQTTTYELVITSVKDKYDAEIKLNPLDVRRQIRIINHLPQSGNMDMALAYYIIK